MCLEGGWGVIKVGRIQGGGEIGACAIVSLAGIFESFKGILSV